MNGILTKKCGIADVIAGVKPISQVWARALDKELYPMLITSHHIGVLEFAIPADADFYTEAEVQAIDKQRV